VRSLFGGRTVAFMRVAFGFEHLVTIDR